MDWWALLWWVIVFLVGILLGMWLAKQDHKGDCPACDRYLTAMGQLARIEMGLNCDGIPGADGYEWHCAACPRAGGP